MLRVLRSPLQTLVRRECCNFSSFCEILVNVDKYSNTSSMSGVHIYVMKMAPSSSFDNQRLFFRTISEYKNGLQLDFD